MSTIEITKTSIDVLCTYLSTNPAIPAVGLRLRLDSVARSLVQYLRNGQPVSYNDALSSEEVGRVIRFWNLMALWDSYPHLHNNQELCPETFIAPPSDAMTYNFEKVPVSDPLWIVGVIRYIRYHCSSAEGFEESSVREFLDLVQELALGEALDKANVPWGLTADDVKGAT